MRPPQISTLFPYTTLFRSANEFRDGFPPSRDRYLPPPSAAYRCGVFLVSRSDPRDDVVTRCTRRIRGRNPARSEEHTSELQSRGHLVCRLLLEKKKYHLCG